MDYNHPEISLTRQCQLLGLSKTALYYKPCGQSALNLELMRKIDKIYTKAPFYGILRITAWLHKQGYAVNHKRVARLMRIMGIQAIYPKPKTSKLGAGHKIYPYLLRDMVIDRPNLVWSADITYIPLQNGFVYLTAIIDWYSRYVLSWQLSISLEADFCIQALHKALMVAKPKIFNTDQGCQFTCDAFTSILADTGILISMDGKGRAFDNIFIERFWRSVKYEEVYLHDYGCVREAFDALACYLLFYNNERLHQSLGYLTPKQVYQGL